jgi:ATP-dependent RNA helicase DDX10/DBP4
VDWVVQADAPEDKDTYIHRVGRTARYTSKGKSLLLVLPNEAEGFLKLLQQNSIPVKMLSMNPQKAVSISQRAASIVAANPDMSRLGKKAFTSYLRSLALMPNKEIFGVSIAKDLPLDDYAASLGLSSTPSIRFLNKLDTRDKYRTKKNKNYKLERLKEQIKVEKLQRKISQVSADSALATSEQKAKLEIGEDDEDDLLLVRKRRDHNEEGTEDLSMRLEPKNKLKRIRVEGTTGFNTKTIFNDEGQEMPTIMSHNHGNFEIVSGEELKNANLEYMKKIQDRLTATKEHDRNEERARIKEKHRKKRLLSKGKTEEDDDEGDFRGGAVLASPKDNPGEDDSLSTSNDESVSDSSEDEDGSTACDADVSAQEAIALAMLNRI